MRDVNVFRTPHLTTSLTGPLQYLEKQFLTQEAKIEQWFKGEWQKTQAPAYGSVDLRNAGFKLAPVDMNLFPAGFNNIAGNPEFVALAKVAAEDIIKKVKPETRTVLLIPENHTRNVFYWENVAALVDILDGAGFEVLVGTLSQDDNVMREIPLQQEVMHVHTVQRVGNQLQVADFIPDVVLLNNDLSEGIPEILQGVTQPLLPPPTLGWSQRLKSTHFAHYADVCEEFARLLQMDPWLIAPLFERCDEVNFMQRTGEACLIAKVEDLLARLQKKYAEYEIPHDPYVVIKADAGTYGMAVMMVRSVEEVQNLNRKQRTHMSKSKGGKPVSSVIVQEGVYTFETWGDDSAVAEPVVYLFGERVIGGFYRVHKDRGIDENLNSPGMHFEPLLFARSCHEPQFTEEPDACPNRFYAYGVIARLSMLAAAREMQALGGKYA